MKFNDDQAHAPKLGPVPALARKVIRETAAAARDKLGQMDARLRLEMWSRLAKHCIDRAQAMRALAPLAGKVLGEVLQEGDLNEQMEAQAMEAHAFAFLAMVQAEAVLDEIEAVEKAK